MRPDWLLPLFLAACALLVQLLGAADAVAYQRVAILNGQAWRLLSGQLAHLSWSHLSMNLAGLLVIWELWGRQLGLRGGGSAMLFCAAAVGCGLLLISRDVVWYVGLSGLLHGLVAAGAVLALRAQPVLNALALAALIAKLTWELLAPARPLDGLVVIADAHLYGAIAGGIYGLLLCMHRAYRPRARSLGRGQP